MSALEMVEVGAGDVLRFNYTNYKLETEQREATVAGFWFGCSTYHQGEQWFMRAFDPTRGDYRNFAMRDMREVRVIRQEAA